MKENVFGSLIMQDGDAAISGVSVRALADQYGTPLYIYDENTLTSTMDAYMDEFRSDEFETRVVYATKAFNCKAMLKLCDAHGLYCDAVSLGEIYTAKRAGIDLSKIYFHGNNKTAFELNRAFEYGVGTIIVDSKEEAEKLVSVAKDHPETSMRTLIRVNPLIEAHTHKHIQTAAPDSKFGIPIMMKERLLETIAILQSADNIHFAGLHCHIGSQLFELEPYIKAVEELADLASDLESSLSSSIEEIDLGGGFGVWYTDADTPNPIALTCKTILDACNTVFKEKGITPKIVTIEPGRSIVAEAGYLLYTVTMIKQSLKDKFYFVDGGMSDLIRPALYQAEYTADLIGDSANEEKELVTIGGKCCESGDIVIRDIMLPPAKEGDLLLIYSAGAYGYAMASNYNKQPLPGVVFVKDGQTRLVIRPQTLDEMIERECD